MNIDQKLVSDWYEDWLISENEDGLYAYLAQRAAEYGAQQERERYIADLSKLQNPDSRQKCIEWIADGTLIDRLISLTLEQEHELKSAEQQERERVLNITYGYAAHLQYEDGFQDAINKV
jgi:hypothetical protein